MLTDNYAAQSTEKYPTLLEASILESTVKFSTGLMNDHFEIAGRLSAIQSDGFVDRAALI
jgi:iron complex outermembrane receptor protein